MEVPYNLTDGQKALLRRLVQEVRAGNLPEEFWVYWVNEKRTGFFSGSEYKGEHPPPVTQGALDALAAAELILSEPHYESHGESSRKCTLRGSAYTAVDSDFDAPDTSFVTQLTPLADITNLDDELKERCVLTLQVGGTNPKMWDMAVRTAVVILEERLRDVGGISDVSIIGRDLVNKVFGDKGELANAIGSKSEQQGYREIYAGVVGVFRNRYAHRLVDPTPEDGGAFIVFVNLLLKMLEELRQPSTT
jgi:uncharacterized protein (TIGR02391 family)